jgi:glucose-1-phosphate adenylyltransferase
MNHSLIILAAGASSRMKASMGGNELSAQDIALANSRTKALIPGPDGHRPVLDYLIHRAKQAGYTDIYLVTGKNLPDFQAFYGPDKKGNNFRGIHIHYAVQHVPEDRKKPLGTADAVWQALEQYPELQASRFSVCNSDNLYSVQALKNLRRSKSPAALVAYDREGLEFSDERISRFALLSIDPEDYLVDIIEKPDLEKMQDFKDAEGKYRVSMNIFAFDGRVVHPYLRDCPLNKQRQEKEIPTALLNLCRDLPKACRCYPMAEHVPDLTSKEDIITFRKYLE